MTILDLPSSLLQRERRVKSWTAAKRGRTAMQLKLLQAKQEETQGAIEEEKEEKKKGERHSALNFAALFSGSWPVSLPSLSLSFLIAC